jgi:hypothetical protein
MPFANFWKAKRDISMVKGWDYEDSLPFSVYFVLALSIAISINEKSDDKRDEIKC